MVELRIFGGFGFARITVDSPHVDDVVQHISTSNFRPKLAECSSVGADKPVQRF
jgi:hypothetical protein